MRDRDNPHVAYALLGELRGVQSEIESELVQLIYTRGISGLQLARVIRHVHRQARRRNHEDTAHRKLRSAWRRRRPPLLR